MGRCYIKPARNSTHYVQWSSIVDSVIGYGTREDMLEHERLHHGAVGVGEAKAALKRADQNGTSDRSINFGSWDDDDLLVMEFGGPGTLKRADIETYAQLACVEQALDSDPRVKALITPLPKDD